jgi:hypothetical protein
MSVPCLVLLQGTSLDSWILLLKRICSLSPVIFLFQVKGITTVLFGFIDNFVLSHHRWTVHRAVCKTFDIVWGNFPLIWSAKSSAIIVNTLQTGTLNI